MIIYHGSNLAVEKPKLIEQTLETLKIKKLYDQMVFTSEKALSFIKFVGTIPEEEM